MSLITWKKPRYTVPTVFVTLCCFLATMLPPRVGRASQADALAPIPQGTGGPPGLNVPPPSPESPEELSTVDIATGAARTSYAFQLPQGRGDAQASLKLNYDSSAGPGFAGVGWTLHVPSIVRKGKAGIPAFADPVLTAPKTLSGDLGTDDYFIDGKLLIPVAVLTDGTPVAGPAVTLPQVIASQGGTWAYFRCEVDDGARYFFGKNSFTWVMQTKSGHILQFGSGGLFGGPPTNGTERGTGLGGTLVLAPYRWNMVSDTDASGNSVFYAYSNTAGGITTGIPNPMLPGTNFLTDVYDTLQPGQPASTTAAYAHHVHVTWSFGLPSGGAPTSVPYGSSPVWKAPPFARLQTVDVTSATWLGTQRQLVREYQLGYTYNATGTRSFLTSITPVGSCQSTGAITENVLGLIQSGATNGCRALPAMTYSYYGVSSSYPTSVPSILKETPGVFQTRVDFPYADSSKPIAQGLADLNGDAVADLSEVDESVRPNKTSVELGSLVNVTNVLTYDNSFLTGSSCGVENSVLGDWAATGRLNALVQLVCDHSMPWVIAQLAPIQNNGLASWVGYPATQQSVALPTSQDVANLETLAGPHSPNPVFDPQRVVDVDGDGLPDLSFGPQAAGTDSGYFTYFTTRDRGGITHPFAVQGPAVTTPAAYDPTALPGSGPSRVMADMDGDGLADLVILSKVNGQGGTSGNLNYLSMRVLPSRGDGRFGVPGQSATYGNPLTPAIVGPVGGDAIFPPNVRLGDLNGDGMADLAILDSTGLHVCLRYGGPTIDAASFHCTTDPNLTPASGGVTTTIDIGDLTASGINEVIYFPHGNPSHSTTGVVVSPNGSQINGTGTPRDGLLQRISNGVGATTQLQYRIVGEMQVPAWAVSSYTTDNGLTGNNGVAVTKQFLYENPIYDPRDRQFVGFTNVAVLLGPDSLGSPGNKTSTTFVTQTCATTSSCQSGTTDYSLQHALRGLPALVEVSDTATPSVATRFRTTFHQYTFQIPYQGLDGRNGISVSRRQTQTYLWDESQAFTTAALQPVTTIVGGNFNGYTPPSLTTPLPSPGTTLQQAFVFDVNGNETAVVDFGVAASNRVSVDTPILEKRSWNLPAGDTSGWSWRLTRKQTGYADSTGSTFNTPASVRRFDYEYYPQGLLFDVLTQVSGGVTLPRPSGGAPQPQDAAPNGATQLVAMQYDSYGNLQEVQTALGQNDLQRRCTVITQDVLYKQLPASITVYPKGCGSSPSLLTQMNFDRGFEQTTAIISPDSRIAVQRFDDFGRVVEVDQPDATLLLAAKVAVKADYSDVGPVRRIHLQTVDGDELGSSFGFVDHFRYLDGLGDTLESIDQAGLASTAPQWIVSGVHARYPNGRVSQTARPVFGVPQLPQSAPPGALPVTAFGSATRAFTYDPLGRVLTSTDFNGALSKSTYHDARLAADLLDPEQISGSHQGALTTISRDGHGRVAQTKQHLANSSHGSGDLITTTDYQATGEPTLVAQFFPGAPVFGLRHSMAYDSLGRMVINVEPNSGAWTYAYNDVGELVGTSDARGCGENLFHDGIGRLVAEDYSPCTPAQAPYTQADFRTGAGAEAFFLYDSPPGMLTASWDLAQHSVYSYDARGRLAGIQRQIAAPTTTGSSSSGSGSGGLTISGTMVDAQGNPMVGLTIQLNGSTQMTATTDANGAYSFSGLKNGSYSMNPPNIANCTFTPSTVFNTNGMTTSQTASFMGVGAGCGGTPISTPIPPVGNIVVSGAVTAQDGNGIQGLQINLLGGAPPNTITHTNASGFYSFNGLGSGTYTLQPSNLPSGCSLTPNVIGNITKSGTFAFSATGTCGVEGLPSSVAPLDARYAPHVFAKSFKYSAANRATTETTGADIPQLTSNGSVVSQVNVNYLLQGIISSVTSSYGSLLASQLVDAAGGVVQQTFGDAANTTANLGYDNNEQLTRFTLQRSAGPNNGAWATYKQNNTPTHGDFTLQTVLTNLTLGYDTAGNSTGIGENTSPSFGGSVPPIDPTQWPPGAQPAMLRSFTYGDDYRVQDAQTRYTDTSGDDNFTPVYTSSEVATYPKQQSPSHRVRHQQYSYDWRGNITSSTEPPDVGVFFDRSLGTVTNGQGNSPGPDQLASTAQGSASVVTQHDAAGNLLSVSDSLTSTVYTYAWDELGRLASATRDDNAQSPPTMQEQFAYDAGGQRMRTTRQSKGTTDHTVVVFDSLVLNHASFPGGVQGDYERDAKTEQLYLNAGGTMLGHVFFDEGSLPQASSGNGPVHVFMTFGDPLGSTSFVIDHDTSELVERPTYLTYGGVESDYRPTRWNSFREDVRYTGHWDDAQVGLVYFGARYYSPQLGRFISPDPLSVHGLAGDPNPYAYVHGSPIGNVDPFGLYEDTMGGGGPGGYPPSTGYEPSPPPPPSTGGPPAPPSPPGGPPVVAGGGPGPAGAVGGCGNCGGGATAPSPPTQPGGYPPGGGPAPPSASPPAPQLPAPPNAGSPSAAGLGGSGSTLGFPPVAHPPTGAPEPSTKQKLHSALSGAGLGLILGFVVALAVEAVGAAIEAATAEGAEVAENAAYQAAKAGGRHAGTLRNYATRSASEIAKAVKGYQRQVAIHAAKIADPASGAANWSQLSAQEQAGLLNKWAVDLARNQELSDVVQGLLDSMR